MANSIADTRARRPYRHRARASSAALPNDHKTFVSPSAPTSLGASVLLLVSAGILAFALFGRTALGADAPATTPVIAVIIDDMGNHRERGLRAIELPGPVSLAFLPGTLYAKRLASLAFALDKEVMLHLPMESARGLELGPIRLAQGMSRKEILRQLGAAVAAVPHLQGFNNHMGSLLTTKSATMSWVMDWARAQGELFFVDSRTSGYSVAYAAARTAGIPSATRDIFLDHDRDENLIEQQFDKLVAKAFKRGHAIAIGHPYPETLAVLSRRLPRLSDDGLRLVPVSALTKISPPTP